jgi:hypothetical protein
MDTSCLALVFLPDTRGCFVDPFFLAMLVGRNKPKDVGAEGAEVKDRSGGM